MRGRDALIVAGRVEPVKEVVLTAEVGTDGTILDLGGDMPSGSATDLFGQSLRSGFGARSSQVFGPALTRRDLAASLLEDLAGAYFVSGTVLLWAGQNGVDEAGLELVSEMQADVCAGWRRGDQQHDHLIHRAAIAQPDGPPSPPLSDLGGSDVWHAHPPLPQQAHRRARLLSLHPSDTARSAIAHFRDSVRDQSPERTLHEYTVASEVDASRTISAVDVAAHVLPWAECPGALASAQTLVGAPVTDLAAFVRRNLGGAETCTHLNATLRSLADVSALADLLDRP